MECDDFGVRQTDVDGVRWSDVDGVPRTDVDGVDIGVYWSDVAAPTTAQLGAPLGGPSLDGDFNTLFFFLYPCFLVSLICLFIKL